MYFRIEKEKEREKEGIEKEKAQLEHNRKQYNYWLNLDPYKFEEEIGKLFEKNGYLVFVTSGSCDGGIDIEITKSGKKGFVQCKKHKKKAGPSIIRDAYGTMIHGNFEYAFIVCPSGFSSNAIDFAKGKKIELLGIDEIIKMAK